MSHSDYTINRKSNRSGVTKLYLVSTRKKQVPIIADKLFPLNKPFPSREELNYQNSVETIDRNYRSKMKISAKINQKVMFLLKQNSKLITLTLKKYKATSKSKVKTS